MSEGGSILDSAEVDFLLGGDSGGKGGGGAQEHEAQEVTMRGDLDQISLSDIFQTLAMSKMEGLLRVRNPLEHRELFFNEGYVRCIVPPRAETRRLGQMLIRAGIVTPDQLRAALLDQKKEKRRQHLGVYLVEQGLASEEDVNDLVMAQLQEDLFALFTWQRGSFEFYRGPVADPILAQRLETTPEFEITGVLMEVARRSDEWETILNELRSLEELFQPSPEAASPQACDGIEDDEVSILEVLDGQHSVRELAESSVLSLFEASRALRTLSQRGLAELVPMDNALEVCRAKIDTGEIKRAGLLVNVLAQRADALSPEFLNDIAGLLSKCGESKEAGNLLLESARTCESIDERAALAREARRVGGRQPEILEFLRQTLEEVGDATPQELFDVTSELADIRIEQAEFEEALELLEILENTQPENPSVSSRLARVLHRLGRADDAVETLLPLAERFRREGAKEKLATVYEQILKIDYRRKDIAKALKQLHAGRLQRHQREIVIAIAILVCAVGGWFWYAAAQREKRLTDLSARVNALLAENDIEPAQKAVAVFESKFGTSPRLRSLQDTVTLRATSERSRRQRDEQEARQEKVAAAGQLLNKGDVGGALDMYRELGEELNQRRELRKTARARLLVLTTDLLELGAELEAAMPPPPSLLQTADDHVRIVASIQSDFSPMRRSLVDSTLSVCERDDITETLDDSDLGDLTSAATAVKALFKIADERLRTYRQQIDKTATAQELTPLFYEAKALEEKYAFDSALAAYRRLAKEYPDDDELRAHFQERVERYSAVLRFLKLIEQATADGDFATARGQLQALQQTYPDIPFPQLVELPLHVDTVPSGARVLVDGRDVGRSPLLTAYSPGEPTRIRIELEGFYADGVVLPDDKIGRIRSLLARRPNWTIESEATIERAIVSAGKGRCFIADRGGNVKCLDYTTGETVWKVATNDLSGLLPRPVRTAKGDVIVASLDGPVRCFAADDGKLLWRADGLPSESGPAVLGDEAFIATTDGKVAVLDTRSGARVALVELEGEIRADLVANRSYVFAITKGGTVHGLRPGGLVAWKTSVGRGVLTDPILNDDRLIVVADDGSLTALGSRRGGKLWQVQGLTEVLVSPVCVRGLVCVPVRDSIRTFRIEDGKPGPTYAGTSPWTAALSTDGTRLFASDRDGWTWVLDPAEGFTPMYRLRGDKAAYAPVVPVGDGWVLAAFGDRTLHGFLDLP